MKKLVLVVLPLVMAACVDRDRAESGASTTFPAGQSTAIPTAGGNAQPGRGEGERETYEGAPVERSPGQSTMGGANTFDTPDVPDRSGVSDLDDADRDSASSSDVFIDDRDVNGFSGQGPVPQSADDLDTEPTDPRDRGTIDEDELDMMPADAVEPSPGMIP